MKAADRGRFMASGVAISVRRTFVLIAGGLLVSGCSNVPGLGGDPVKIQFESNPPGAEVGLSSGGSCKTPCALPAPDKSGSYAVTFDLAGYYTQTSGVRVTRDKPNWFAPENVAIDPNPVRTTLQPSRPAPRR
jgi:hypothetical protein